MRSPRNTPVPDHLAEQARTLVATAVLQGMQSPHTYPRQCCNCPVYGDGCVIWLPPPLSHRWCGDHKRESVFSAMLWTCKHCGAMAYDAMVIRGDRLAEWLEADP